MSHIFISYSHNDEEIAKKLKTRLENQGFIVWFDRHSIEGGVDWGEAIDQGINKAFVILLVMTKASLNSRYVTYEWAYALGLNRKMIPLQFENIPDVHARLTKLQIVNFSESKQGSDSWQKLYDNLRELRYDFETNDIRANENASDELKSITNDLNNYAVDKRRAAVEMLGKRGQEDAVDILVQVLHQEESDDVRKAAIRALKKLVELRLRMRC